MAGVNINFSQVKEKAGSLTNMLVKGGDQTTDSDGVSLKALKTKKESLIQDKQKYYGYLGMAVYDLNKEKGVQFEEFSAELGKLHELDKEIEEVSRKLEIKEQEQARSGKNVCPNCGGKLSSKDKFCKGCGMPIKGDTIVCHCGNEVKRIDKFCPVCGTSVEQLLNEEAGKEAFATGAEKGVEKICICGAKIAPGQFMCMECGRKVSD